MKALWAFKRSENWIEDEDERDFYFIDIFLGFEVYFFANLID